MTRTRNPTTETGEPGSPETDQQNAEAQPQQPQAPLMGGAQDNEGTTTDPMIKNKPS